MAEKQTAMTPSREERRTGLSRPYAVTSPFRSLQRFADEMDRVFEDFGFGRSWLSPSWRESGFGGGRERELGGFAPQVDVFQKNNELTIRADLPGLKKDEVSVEVTDDAVTIQGERKREHEEEREGFYRSERSYGGFYRVIPLPEGAITDQAKADFRNGVLEITMPAPPKSQGRRIEITDASTKK